MSIAVTNAALAQMFPSLSFQASPNAQFESYRICELQAENSQDDNYFIMLSRSY